MKNLNFLVKVTITALLLTVVFWVVDWKAALKQMINANLLWLGFVLLAYVAALILSAVRWERLLAVISKPIGVSRAIGTYWLGALSGNVLPSMVGTDLVRITIAKKYAGAVNAAASIVAERLTGLFTLLLLCAVTIFLPLGQALIELVQIDLNTINLLLGLVAAGLASLLALMVLARIKLPQKLSRFRQKIFKMFEQILVYRKAGYALVETCFLSFIFYLCLTAAQFGLLKSVGAEITFLMALGAVPFISLINMIPITINGLGLAEGAFIVLYGLLGVPPDQALAASVLRRIAIIVSSLGGFYYWFKPEFISLSKTQAENSG